MSKLIVGVNDLATLRPDLATQLVDPSLAKTVTLGSGMNLEWFCRGTSERPHPRFQWTCWVAHRVSGRGCPACKGKAVIVGWNDLATTHPNLAAQLVIPDDALGVTAGSKRRLNWKCLGTKERPHPRYEWTAQVVNRVSERGCPACKGKAVIVGWNDLATTHPNLAAQLTTPDEALTVTAGSNRRLGWRCSGTKGRPHPRYEWPAKVVNRVNGRGCSACSGKVVVVGWNDLATTHPNLAAQLVNPDDALVVSAGSNSILRWRCSGTSERPHPSYEWTAQVVNRVNGRGCSVCSKGVILVGWNDFATTHPHLAAQLVQPELGRAIAAGNGNPLKWWCEGTDAFPHPYFEWTASASTRTRSGCPACSTPCRSVIAGWNDLATTDPDLASQLVDASLAVRVTRGSSKKARWRCLSPTHGEFEWDAEISSRSHGTGCPRCAPRGFDPSEQGYVYVISDPITYRGNVFHVTEFGISNHPEDRLSQHADKGFTSEPLRLLFFESGADAQALEKSLKMVMKAHGVSSAHSQGLYVDGFTEAFLTDKVGAEFLTEFWATVDSTP